MTLRYDEKRADKYSADDLKDLLAKGQAMKNPDGDPSYPVGDEEDIKKAVKAVGRGNADHDAIRAHVIAGAKKLGLSDLIPDNWNADGSLADAAEAKSAPPTREERAEESMSFGNIQSALYSALAAVMPFGGDFWIVDCGTDWAVWRDYDKGGYFKVGYTMGDDGAVTFTGPSVEVTETTTYAPVPQTNSGEPVGETRADKVDCPTCKGKGTIMDGNRDCPDCIDGQVTAAKAKELKSAGLPSRSRRRPLQHQRRSLDRLPEWRRMTSAFERRVEQEGNDIVLRGMPIRYDSFYRVRDMLGPFDERMKPGVATRAMQSTEFDCRFLHNHDGLSMARSTSGTLTFEDCSEGLRAIPRLDARQQFAYDLAISVERGDTSQMSVGFMVSEEGDEWRWGDDGIEKRDVFEFADLFDVSAVTYPASPTTSIELAQRMMARAGAESRERIRRLFDIGGQIRSGHVLAPKDGDDLRAAAEALYKVEGVGIPLQAQIDAYRHASLSLFAAFRAGKVLSSDNESALQAALEALHAADDIDIPGITAQLETIDKALDLGQAGLAEVLGKANPDGDAADKNPTLVGAMDPASDKDARSRRQRKLKLLSA